jgi:signal recognition particle subunit SRP54
MDLQDFLGVMKQMQSLGPLKGVLGMLPGVNAQMLSKANVDEKRLKHVEAIVLSMTPRERADPDLINGSRRLRIARGAGRPVQEVNQLLAQFGQMKKFMKSAGKPGVKLPFGPRFPA